MQRGTNKALLWSLAALLTALSFTAVAVYVTQPLNRVYLAWIAATGILLPLIIAASTKPLASEHEQDRQQLRRVSWYLPVAVAANALVSPLYLNDEVPRQVHYIIAAAVYLATFTMAPVLLLRRAYWLWPAAPRPAGSAAAGVAGLLACGHAVVIIVLSPEWVRVDVSPQQALASVAYTMVGSFSEELVFRVMLLSYMASVMRSPLAGLIASSTIFGFIHVPFNLVDHGVFSFQLSEPQVTAVPLMQTALGCLCGIVWLRTRSLLLVGLVHAIVNVPPGLSEFSAVWN